MTTSNGPEVPLASASRVLCSSWARDQKLDPIGTAGCYRGYLLLEWPLPWPRDLSEDPALEPVVSLVRREGLRLQGLVPASGGGSRRIIAYRWPDGGGARFERTELVVGPRDVIVVALAILDEQPCSEETTDVLVCTHGRRDRCCGSLGTALAQELLADHRQLGDDVRLWRTSHTGGHRFAATALVLPQGTAWAFCDKDTLVRIVHRIGPVGDLLPRYRGCAGMASPAVQALERAVAREVGWPLFDIDAAPNSETAVPSSSSRRRAVRAWSGKLLSASAGRCSCLTAVCRWNWRQGPSSSLSLVACSAASGAWRQRFGVSLR